jgi:hypothetical protein
MKRIHAVFGIYDTGKNGPEKVFAICLHHAMKRLVPVSTKAGLSVHVILVLLRQDRHPDGLARIGQAQAFIYIV